MRSVLSAGDGDWLANDAIVGSTAVVQDSVVTVATDAGTHDVPNRAKYAYGL